MVRSLSELERIDAVTRAIFPRDRSVHLKCREKYGRGRLFTSTRTGAQITGGEMSKYGIVGDIYQCATCHFRWKCVKVNNGMAIFEMWNDDDQ